MDPEVDGCVVSLAVIVVVTKIVSVVVMSTVTVVISSVLAGELGAVMGEPTTTTVVYVVDVIVDEVVSVAVGVDEVVLKNSGVPVLAINDPFPETAVGAVVPMPVAKTIVAETVVRLADLVDADTEPDTAELVTSKAGAPVPKADKVETFATGGRKLRDAVVGPDDVALLLLVDWIAVAASEEVTGVDESPLLAASVLENAELDFTIVVLVGPSDRAEEVRDWAEVVRGEVADRSVAFVTRGVEYIGAGVVVKSGTASVA